MIDFLKNIPYHFEHHPLVTIILLNKTTDGTLKNMFTSHIKDHFRGQTVIIESNNKKLKISRENLRLSDIESLLNQIKK